MVYNTPWNHGVFHACTNSGYQATFPSDYVAWVRGYYCTRQYTVCMLHQTIYCLHVTPDNILSVCYTRQYTVCMASLVPRLLISFVTYCMWQQQLGRRQWRRLQTWYSIYCLPSLFVYIYCCLRNGFFSQNHFSFSELYSYMINLLAMLANPLYVNL